MDVDAAIGDLERSALVENVTSDSDGQRFVGVPLAVSLFGQKKLLADPLRNAVEADHQLLVDFGAAQRVDVRHGLEPRIRRLFSTVSDRISKLQSSFPENLPVLEFVCQGYPPAFLLLADLHAELGDLVSSREALRRFVEQGDPERKTEIWQRIAELCKKMDDYKSELHAWSEFAQASSGFLDSVSEAANRINSILRQHPTEMETEEKRVLVTRVIETFHSHLPSLSGTDLSRLAWLYLNVHNPEKAKEFTELGKTREPGNEHIQKLTQRLAAY